MKKLSIIAMSLLLIVGTPLLVNADQVKDPTKGESEATITFNKGEGPTDPVIPPTEGGDGNEPTGNEGALTVDVVPNLNFGTQTIKATKQDFKATNSFPYVQVTDTRGTGEKWFLTMGLSNFVLVGNSNEVIEKAQITFNNGLINRAEHNLSDGSVGSIVHDGSIVQTDSKITVVAGADSASKIMFAPNGNATGTWLTSWGKTDTDNDLNSNVVLNMDTSNAKIGTYTATADWTVTSEQP